VASRIARAVNADGSPSVSLLAAFSMATSTSTIPRHSVALTQCRADLAWRAATSSLALVWFEIVGAVVEQETIATGRQIREIRRLRKAYGPGRWRKRKGIARVKLPDGRTCTAEIHWYEAYGIGRKETKIKRIIA
jgi:hypothetical protein